MTNSQKGDYILGGLLFLVAGRSGNWLITPMSHPTATPLEYGLTWIQILICLIAGARLLQRSRSTAANS